MEATCPIGTPFTNKRFAIVWRNWWGVPFTPAERNTLQLLVNLPIWPARDLDAWFPERWKQAHFPDAPLWEFPVPATP